MKKEGKLSSFLYASFLALVAIALIGGMVYWVGNIFKGVAKETTIDINSAESVVNSKIEIKNVEIDNLHKSDMYITLENQGKLTVEKVQIEVAKDDIIYKDIFPEEVEYKGRLLDLQFLQVKKFAVFFDNVNDLSNYTKVDVIPIVRLEDKSLKTIDVAKDTWVPQG